jgi:hypothetical protein
VGGTVGEPEGNAGEPTCHTVTRPPGAAPADWVAAALEQALAGWLENRDERTLRMVLARLVAVLS